MTNGSSPFAGDRRLLTTVSPNRDGFRDAAVVHFTAHGAGAHRQLEVVQTDMATKIPGRIEERGGTTIVWRTAGASARGAATMTWTTGPATQPRTYILRLRVGLTGLRRLRPRRETERAPVVRVQGIDAGFSKRSYAPGEAAVLASRPTQRR